MGRLREQNLEAFEVSKEVGNVKNNSPELLNLDNSKIGFILGRQRGTNL